MGYPSCWVNVHEDEMVATICQYGASMINVTVPKGMYTKEKLVKLLNGSVKKVSEDVVMTEIQDSGVVVWKTRGEWSVKLNDALAQLYGWEKAITLDWFVRSRPSPETTNRIAPRSRQDWDIWWPKHAGFDLSRGYQLFYMYANNLVRPLHLGNTKSELLRYIIARPGDGQSISEEFNTLNYLPLKAGLTKLSHLRVDIRDELGRLVEFQKSQAPPSVTLLFEIGDRDEI
jgi:hypothetical protein